MANTSGQLPSVDVCNCVNAVRVFPKERVCLFIHGLKKWLGRLTVPPVKPPTCSKMNDGMIKTWAAWHGKRPIKREFKAIISTAVLMSQNTCLCSQVPSQPRTRGGIRRLSCCLPCLMRRRAGTERWERGGAERSSRGATAGRNTTPSMDTSTLRYPVTSHSVFNEAMWHWVQLMHRISGYTVRGPSRNLAIYGCVFQV